MWKSVSATWTVILLGTLGGCGGNTTLYVSGYAPLTRAIDSVLRPSAATCKTGEVIKTEVEARSKFEYDRHHHRIDEDLSIWRKTTCSAPP